MKKSGYNDMHNDLQRESIFYSVTLAGVKIGIEKMLEYNIPIYRPNDYYCEMIKPDEHMKKIREKLMIEKKRINTVNQRKITKEQRKIQKSIQTERVKEKSQIKKRAKIEAEKYQKMSNRDTSRSNDDIKIQRSTLPIVDKTLRDNSMKKHEKQNKRINHKREYKNQKYGFGGKKKHIKDNTAESSADMSEFSNKRNRTGKQSYKRTMNGAGSQRMGKSKRQKLTNRL